MNRCIRNPQYSQGFTLAEVLVALLMGLIGTIVMMQVFAVSEGQKRTTTSGADAQTNGGIALYSVERDVRMAGYGISSPPLLTCPSIAMWDQDAGSTKNFKLYPFVINPPVADAPAGDAGSDVIMMSFGNSALTVEPTQVVNPSGSAAVLKVKNRAGFNQGDLVVSVQVVGGVYQCAVREVTNVPGGQCGDPEDPSGGSSNVIANNGTYSSVAQGCKKVDAKHNRPGGIPGIDQLNEGSELYNLGSLPRSRIYAIRNQSLTVCDSFVSDCTNAANYTVLVNDIVAMRAVYGYDANDDQRVADTEWTRATPTTGDEFRRLTAVRLALVARSAIREKPNAAGDCDTTTDATKPDKQTWIGDSVVGAGFDLSATSADWGCYRYKLFQTVVPLRNMIWKQK